MDLIEKLYDICAVGYGIFSRYNYMNGFSVELELAVSIGL